MKSCLLIATIGVCASSLLIGSAYCSGVTLRSSKIYDESFKRAAFEAANTDNATMMNELLENLDPLELKTVFNMKGKHLGMTIFHHAAWQNSLRVAQVLLKHREYINVKSTGGSTPLGEAAFAGHYKMVELLLEKNANPNVTNNKGETPLHFATYKGNYHIAHLLLKNSANPNIQNSSGETPLHIAMRQGNTSMARMLLKNNADPCICNNNNETPLQCASSTPEMEQLISKCKSDPNDGTVDTRFADLEEMLRKRQLQSS